jgi:hypothetical protein
MDMSGSCIVEMGNISYDKVSLDLSGSGDIDLGGEADELDVSLSGSGYMDALGCPVKTAEVQMSGSGSMKLDVSDKLTARVSGSGQIRYEGAPVLDVEISGSGSVKKI